jgi:hypothetical protein
MDWRLMVALALSEAISAALAFKLLSGSRSAAEKAGLVLVLLIPFVGPLFYFFLVEDVPSQHPLLRNGGPRGRYTDSMIGIRADIEAADVQPKALAEAQEDSEDPGTPGKTGANT